ncbi:MAG: hypothetical protein AB9842_00020 [Bacteroidales bacterium]
MLLYLLHLAISYAYFWISGFVVYNLFHFREIPSPVSVTFPLAGFLINIPLLSAISLLFPVNASTFLIISGIFLLYFIFHKILSIKKSPDYKTTGSPFNISYPSLFTLHPSLIVLFVLLVICSAATPSLPDMWGYHVQAIQWTEKYAVIPGLGNLSTKLAFNFGTFLPQSLLSFREIIGQPLISLNIFLFSLLFIFLGHFVKRNYSILVAGTLLLSAFSVFHFFKPVLTSTSVESSSAALTLLLFLLMYSRREPDKNQKSFINCLIILLLILLPVIKLTNSIFLLMLIPLWTGGNKKTRILIPLILTICWVPWLTRNFILSGYLWYPFPFIDFFNPDWKIPPDTALMDFNWIRSWAREPFQASGEILEQPLKVWVIQWFMKTGFFTWFFLAAGTISSLALFFIKKVKRNIPPLIMTFYLVNILVLISWFFVAPDPRFIIGPLVLFLTIPLILIFSSVNTYLSERKVNVIITIVTGFFFIFEAFISQPCRIEGKVKPAAFPTTSMDTRQLNGISINIPVKGVNCYDYPIPCSPALSERLELRGASVKQGFRIKNK